ncbi:hypothetical protein SBA3_3020009 [Candidatus Sulfopaludibacter sp. SbA3]|nr:hypothetical protein SBA3_3020009 [Candidatus Sulfopaludibacter sp. SbA3]
MVSPRVNFPIAGSYINIIGCDYVYTRRRLSASVRLRSGRNKQLPDHASRHSTCGGDPELQRTSAQLCDSQ